MMGTNLDTLSALSQSEVILLYATAYPVFFFVMIFALLVILLGMTGILTAFGKLSLAMPRWRSLIQKTKHKLLHKEFYIHATWFVPIRRTYLKAISRFSWSSNTLTYSVGRKYYTDI